jgi:hypothetical protein
MAGDSATTSVMLAVPTTWATKSGTIRKVDRAMASGALSSFTGKARGPHPFRSDR